jgi:hypothetical protein
VDEPTSKTSLEERLRGALDKVDEFSKSASQAVKKGFDKTKKTVKDTYRINRYKRYDGEN